MSLQDLTDAQLADEIQVRVAEQGRRRFLKMAEQEQARLTEAYEEAISVEPARPIEDIPTNEAVGPGGKLIDADGVEWINQSGAWLSPHAAGPKDYPMGWRLASPPDPVDVTPWAPGQTVAAGDLRSYGGFTYRCIQGHTTQAGWTPPAVPALWAIA